MTYTLIRACSACAGDYEDPEAGPSAAANEPEALVDEPETETSQREIPRALPEGGKAQGEEADDEKTGA